MSLHFYSDIIKIYASDITERPSALFIDYDLLSTGSASLNIENITDSGHRFFGYISNGTVPLQDSCELYCLMKS